MILWWHQTPIWQRLVFFGLAMALYVLGMHTWVWSSLDRSIAMLNQDIVGLTKKNQEVIQNVALVKDVEQEVVILREKLSPRIEQLPVRIEPQTFRRDVVNIGKRTGVAVRLWKPKNSLMDVEQSDASPDIIVRVEGSFHSTGQFLSELLELPWIQTVNPLVLTRKQNSSNLSIVTTDFTINGLVPKRLQQTNRDA